MKPDAQQIIADARKLKDDRFQKRDAMLKARARERYNETAIEIPEPYKVTSQQHRSNIISDEGRQIATLVHAVAVPHIKPYLPEDQPLTTRCEQFLVAMIQELEDKNGPVLWENTSAQVHDNIAFLYFGQKRVPYQGQPKPPEEADVVATAEYGLKNDRYKRDAGISAVFDYRFVPTATAYWTGNVYDPHCFYEIKEVSERELMKVYGVRKDANGGFSAPAEDLTTIPSGYPMDEKGSETRVMVVEYWDREWCMIVAETSERKWLGRREVRGAHILQDWEHNWGRVPYFARPCFVSEQLDEDKKFEGPLDGAHNEMPEYKRLRTMASNIAHQTAFAAYQEVTASTDMGPVADDTALPVTDLKFTPGMIKRLRPGAKIEVVPQSPEIAVFMAELAASEMRLQRYLLSPIAKGISPGADTANAALSNLHRFQLSTLDPMAQENSHQMQAVFRFALERVKDMGETVFAFNSTTDAYTSLNADEIVSVNVQAKATPDQGQFQLLIEKHAMEMWLSGAITELEFHEMRGKENPEELVAANQVERLRKTLDPIILQQVVASLGMLDAVNAMIQENAQSGDARNAVPGLMGQAAAMQQGQPPTGMGSGANGQPRTPGARMPVEDINTARAQAGGY